MDNVILEHQKELETIKGHLKNAKTRLERAKANILRPDGTARLGFAQEVASRQIEIESIAGRVATHERELQHAIDDEPRREAAHKKAEELTAHAKALEPTATKLKDQLEAVTAKIAGFLADADEQNRASRYSQNRLNRFKKQAEEEKANEKADLVRCLGFERDSCFRAYEDERIKPNPDPERLSKLHASLKQCEQELAALNA